jgi:hypothetical protein
MAAWPSPPIEYFVAAPASAQPVSNFAQLPAYSILPVQLHLSSHPLPPLSYTVSQ